jgi:hypothetical protein
VRHAPRSICAQEVRGKGAGSPPPARSSGKLTTRRGYPSRYATALNASMKRELGTIGGSAVRHARSLEAQEVQDRSRWEGIVPRMSAPAAPAPKKRKDGGTSTAVAASESDTVSSAESTDEDDSANETHGAHFGRHGKTPAVRPKGRLAEYGPGPPVPPVRRVVPRGVFRIFKRLREEPDNTVLTLASFNNT